MEEISLTMKDVEDYFRKRGIEVHATIDRDYQLGKYDILIRPMVVLKLSITDEILSIPYDSEIIEDMLNESFSNLREYYFKLLDFGSHKLTPTKNVDTFCIFYNPDNVDTNLMYRWVIAMEI